jgi:predicted dehydrogenase
LLFIYSSFVIGEWNKDVTKSGDTLVEKCCHFFDLFRLISGGQEMKRCISTVQRGLLSEEYGVGSTNPAEDGYDTDSTESSTSTDILPIIDSAYVLLDFQSSSKDGTHPNPHSKQRTFSTMGCLELSMFADGARHQEEIIVTGLHGRVEAYLPENKVYAFRRSDPLHWTDRSKPPPKSSIESFVVDCSDLNVVYPSFAKDIPSAHTGYHYASTAIEWKLLLDQVQSYHTGGMFIPQVTLADGMKAVEMGLSAQQNILNESMTTHGVAHNSSDILDSSVLLQSLWRFGGSSTTKVQV